MIIDDHVHLGGLYQDTDYFLHCLDEANVDSVLATPYMFEEENIPMALKIKWIPPQLVAMKPVLNIVSKTMGSNKFGKRYIKKPPNEYVASKVQEYPDRIKGVYWTNPNLESPEEAEKNIKEYGFVALKFHQVLYPCKFKENCSDYLDMAVDMEIPVFIHTGTPDDVRCLAKHIEKKTDLKVILAHMNFYEEIAEDIKDVSNIYLDISPVYAQNTKRMKHALDNIGAERLIFGTDAPCPGYYKYALNRVNKLDIPQVDKNKIMGENIMNLIEKRATVKN